MNTTQTTKDDGQPGLGASSCSAFSDNEGPTCPFCDRQYTADEPEYMNETPHEIECDQCGKTFMSECSISISWSTYSVPNAQDEPQRK